MRAVLPLLSLLSLLRVTSAQVNAGELMHRVAMMKEARERWVDNPSYSPLLFDNLQPHRLLSLIDINGVNVTLECAEDMGMFLKSVMTLFDELKDKLMGADVNITLTDFDKNVLIPALDAAGKPGTGILRGHLQFHGQMHECKMIDYTPEGRSRKYKLDFGRLFIDGGLRTWQTKGACKMGTQIGLDLCLPSACSTGEIFQLFRSVNMSGGSPVCKFINVNSGLAKPVAGTYIVYAVMGVIVGLCICSGIVDYFLHDIVKAQAFTRGLGWKMFMAFSFYRNIADIFSTGSAKKAGQIGPIHCIRFFSMCWVIMGHMLAVFAAFGNNPLDVFQVTYDTTTGILTNSFFAVDSFFFLSGLLLGFIWFKDFNKDKKRTMSPLAWVMLYVHRILRLSPPYYILIFFWTFCYTSYLRNMPQFMFYNMASDKCRENWWIDLIYLNNYIDHKHQCYLVSWYLSTDMQIFLFSPLILIPLALSPIAGIIVAFGIFAVSTGVNIWQVYHYYFPPSDYSYGLQDPRMKDFDDYTMLMYDAPYIRCQIYIIGMLVGYLLQNKKTMRINHVLNLVLWALSGALMLCVTLGLHDWMKGNELSLFWRAMYNAFSKPAWGLGLAWIIISCYYGYGGPINTFMSWNIWVPLGRLSYCAYLIHICIITYVLGLNEGDLFWSSFSDTAANYIIPVIAITYFFAIFWSAAFEISLGKVEMLLIGGLRGRAPVRESKPRPQHNNPHVLETGKKKEHGAEEGDNWAS